MLPIFLCISYFLSQLKSYMSFFPQTEFFKAYSISWKVMVQLLLLPHNFLSCLFPFSLLSPVSIKTYTSRLSRVSLSLPVIVAFTYFYLIYCQWLFGFWNWCLYLFPFAVSVIITCSCCSPCFSLLISSAFVLRKKFPYLLLYVC